MANKRFSSGTGPSQRQLRVGELIRRTLSDVLNRAEIHDPDLNRMSITVGEVSCSPDLKVATVYVMPLMGSYKVEEAIEALARNKAELRHRVASELTLNTPQTCALGQMKRLIAWTKLGAFSDPKVRQDISSSGNDEDLTGED